MFNITEVEKAAKMELANEQREKALNRITGHLRKITAARQVLANLELEYEVLKRDIGSEV